MAASNAVWGIDIGHCALKALRCGIADDGKSLVAEAFDYIEYPKILTQPDAEPEQLVKDALQKFLANNNVRDAKVGISVSGQSGLARFINLPPVDAKKIPDIVKFEAKQQIPFPLEDVIWDYQALGGPSPDDGIATDLEVGLFAMKRDQVFRALRPFRDAGIELDIVQLTPIAIYNAVTYGVIDNLSDASEYDPDNPPDSVVVISMGTDTTDLVITNGFKIWQRSIPIGGSHFTKQLMKDMKLTFAKAEHLKRHARDADDPKAVFQAMRPVFNDMVQELQRSIGFFRSIDRSANITKGVILGNTVRLPGLQPYLEKNLEIPMKKVADYERLTGSSVTSTPKFKDNVLSFAVSYGLCLQGLGKGRLSTNLIPRELITARIIRRKKPWAIAALTLLMVGFAFNYMFHWNRWRETHPSQFETGKNKLQTISQQSQQLITQDQADRQMFAQLRDRGKSVVGGADSRFMLLELMKTVNAMLPREEGLAPTEISQLAYSERPNLFIQSIEMEYFPDISTYMTENVTSRYTLFKAFLAENERMSTTGAVPESKTPDATGDDATSADDTIADDAADVDGTDTSATSEAPPEVSIPDVSGAAWVVQLKGFHFYDKGINKREQYLINTILKNLDSGNVQLPVAPGGETQEFTMKELGIYLPILADEGHTVSVSVPDPNYKPSANPNDSEPKWGSSGMNKEREGYMNVPGFEFTIQFIWKENTVTDRLEKRQAPAVATTNDDA